MKPSLARAAFSAFVAGLVACGEGRPKYTATAEGFSTPESVKYDSELDMYFVSNINGHPNRKDNNGFISRVTPFGRVENLNFVTGGQAFVTLDAPKGMAIVGDTLWVADIDAMRAFNKRTGQPVASVEFQSYGAQFLNDVAVGPNGALYITDTGIQIEAAGPNHLGPDRIFRLAPDRTITVEAQGDTLGWPNGIAWDGRNSRFLVASFGKPTIMGWKPGESSPSVVATGPGGFDGVEVLRDGRVLVSSWADSSLYMLELDGTLKSFLSDVPAPADIGFDTRRQRVAIPLFTTNRVEIWQLP
jgi:sugar lactone lactonase YvrE